MMKDFEAKWDVDIRLSTFNDADEALTKIASESLGFDLYFPSYDSVGKLIQADLLRPLNADYLDQPVEPVGPLRRPVVGPRRPLHDPLHRLQHRHRLAHRPRGRRPRRRTTPRGTSSGTPSTSGNVAILDDWHTAMAMVLLRNGYDVNTTSAKELAVVREQLLELRSTMRPKVTISMYSDMPAGQYGLAQFWSGDAINMPYYLPKKTDPGILRYWAPPDGRGEIDNDLVVCLGQGDNPVAAHYFMNAILDETAAPARTSASPATSRR